MAGSSLRLAISRPLAVVLDLVVLERGLSGGGAVPSCGLTGLLDLRVLPRLLRPLLALPKVDHDDAVVATGGDVEK